MRLYSERQGVLCGVGGRLFVGIAFVFEGPLRFTARRKSATLITSLYFSLLPEDWRCVVNHTYRAAVVGLLAAATTIGAAQAQTPEPLDIRTGVYRGHRVTYQVINGLAIWEGDVILGTPEELEPPGRFPAYQGRGRLERSCRQKRLRLPLDRRRHPLCHRRGSARATAGSRRHPALERQHLDPVSGENE